MARKRSKKNKNIQGTKVVLLAIIAGILAGGLTAFAFVELRTPSEEELIKDFYLTETAVHVSPHGLRKAMAKGETDFVLVDLRSQEEYNEAHIIGAVTIPAYRDRDTSDYGARDRIVSSFRALVEQNPGKDIIVYCYSIPCMTGRKVGAILAENGIFVQHLGIGWNEWRYFWRLWNHEHEWNITNVEDFIWRGPEPGFVTANITGAGCPIEGEFGC